MARLELGGGGAWCALAHTGNQTEDTPVRVQINAALKIK